MSSPIRYLTPLAGFGNARIRTPGSTTSRPIDERFSEIRNVRDFGAEGDGVTDDHAAIQLALDTLGESGHLFFPPGTYLVSEKIKFQDCQTLTSRTSAYYPAGTRVTIKYTGTSGTLIGSDDPTVATRNVVLKGIEFDGGTGADLIVDFTMVGYSRLEDCNIRGSKAAVVGMKIDDLSMGNTAYWNELVSSRFWVSGSGETRNLRITGGANYNRMWNCFFGYAERGVYIDNNAIGNSIDSCGFQGVAGTEKILLYVDAGLQSIENCFFEHCTEKAIEVTTNGSLWRFGTRYGGDLADKIVDNGFAKFGIDNVPDHTTSPTTFNAYLHAGRFTVKSPTQFTSVASADIDNPPISASGSSTLRFFRNTTTTGARAFTICPGDGTATSQFNVDPATGNTSLRGYLQSLAFNSQLRFPNAGTLEFRRGSGTTEELCLGTNGNATAAKLTNASGIVSVQTGDNAAYCEIIAKRVRMPLKTITWGVNTGINFLESEAQMLTLAGDTTFSTANCADGRWITLYITCDGTLRNLVFPASWKWIGTPVTTIAAGLTAKLELACHGSTDAEVFADWEV